MDVVTDPSVAFKTESTIQVDQNTPEIGDLPRGHAGDAMKAACCRKFYPSQLGTEYYKRSQRYNDVGALGGHIFASCVRRRRGVGMGSSMPYSFRGALSPNIMEGGSIREIEEIICLVVLYVLKTMLHAHKIRGWARKRRDGGTNSGQRAKTLLDKLTG